MGQQRVDAVRVAESFDELDDVVFRTHFDSLPGPAYIWRRDGEDFRLIAHNRAGATIGQQRMESAIDRKSTRLNSSH